jgi:uncharacterized membrane protein YdjX (TVP38/TMEM64 family)
MSTDKAVSSNARIRLIFRVLGLIMFLGTAFGFLAVSGFQLESVMASVEETTPASFVICMSLLPLFGFPISAFYLFAGSAFPWWQATLLCSLALALNMSAAYLLARSLLRTPINALMAHFRKELPVLREDNQFRVTFLVRSIPGVPFFMQNYMLPLLGVRFGTYFLISWSIQSLFAAGMAALPHLVQKVGLLWAGIGVGIIFLFVVFRKLYLRRSPKQGREQI